jgi:hypothetical protein
MEPRRNSAVGRWDQAMTETAKPPGASVIVAPAPQSTNLGRVISARQSFPFQSPHFHQLTTGGTDRG